MIVKYFQVKYGTRPGSVTLYIDGREPLVIWERAEAVSLVQQLDDAVSRAWPSDHR